MRTQNSAIVTLWANKIVKKIRLKEVFVVINDVMWLNEVKRSSDSVSCCGERIGLLLRFCLGVCVLLSIAFNYYYKM